MNRPTNFKVIGLTRLGIKSVSTAPETNVLTTRPSEFLPEYQDFVTFCLNNGLGHNA